MECDQDFGQCKSLVILDIKDTNVPPRGARLAMEHLPTLQIFKCPFTLQVAAQIFREFQSKNTEVRQLPLMDLRCGSERIRPYKKGDLEAAIALCPSVVHVKIRFEWNNPFTDKELKYLLNLKNLQHLFLEGNPTTDISFEGGILPILEKFGPSTLEKLQLYDLPDVDVSAIAQHCANLRFLTLECNFRYLTPSRPLKPTDNRLRSLECLKVRQSDDDENSISKPPPTIADLLILLSSPALTTLHFDVFECDFPLLDEVMEEASRLYGFPNLQELCVGYCQKAFTERSIELLLTLDNPLEEIYFFDGLWTRPKEQLLKKWKSEAKKNNWNLSIKTD